MAIFSEDDIRDTLASDISVLGVGLTLVDKEAYLPNPIGTRSFIDLLAVDEQDRYVLIELKRSNASAREAIHEIFKYVEAAKAHLGARESELQIVIASTEWTELLVPYSRFQHETSLDVIGKRLDVSQSGSITCTDVQALPLNKGRAIAPWHDLCLYRNTESFERGIAEHQVFCKERGIEDFVILLLKAAPDFNATAQEQFVASYRANLEPLGADVSDERMTVLVDQLGSYHYAIYFGMRMMSKQEGLALIPSGSLKDEIDQYFENDEDEEGLSYLHQSIASMEPRPSYDYYEIGYPAKLSSRILGDEAWEIIELRRFGVFARNQVLTDAAIISELMGEDGSTGQMLSRSITLANRSQVNSAASDVKRMLEDNPRWQSHILRFVDEEVSNHSDGVAKLHIYNPATGLLTLFFYLASGGDLRYLPSYYIHVSSNGGEIVYMGYIGYRPTVRQFGEVLSKFYDGDLWGVLLSFTWGGHDSRDTDILEYLGLTYRSFKIVDPEERREVFVWEDERWTASELVDPFSGLNDFINDNEDFVEALMREIGTGWKGGIVDASP